VSLCRSIDSNPDLVGFLPASLRSREFTMSYGVSYNVNTGVIKLVGPDNYGLGGATLYTGSGPLWRTKITNWEGLANNSAQNPSPQPSPDPCVLDPFAGICVMK
jgi:hypothetical protein